MLLISFLSVTIQISTKYVECTLEQKTQSFDKPQKSLVKKSQKEVGKLLVILILRTLKLFQYDK